MTRMIPGKEEMERGTTVELDNKFESLENRIQDLEGIIQDLIRENDARVKKLESKIDDIHDSLRDG